jgi:hypothetical protein
MSVGFLLIAIALFLSSVHDEISGDRLDGAGLLRPKPIIQQTSAV